MTFGFQFDADARAMSKAWREPYMQAVSEAIKDETLSVGMIGGFTSYEFIPLADKQWQYKANIPSALKIEPLVINGGIVAVDDDEPKSYSLQPDEYETLLAHGWTFATADQYSYIFTPTSVGRFWDCRHLETGEIIELTDLNTW